MCVRKESMSTKLTYTDNGCPPGYLQFPATNDTAGVTTFVKVDCIISITWNPDSAFSHPITVRTSHGTHLCLDGTIEDMHRFLATVARIQDRHQHHVPVPVVPVPAPEEVAAPVVSATPIPEEGPAPVVVVPVAAPKSRPFAVGACVYYMLLVNEMYPNVTYPDTLIGAIKKANTEDQVLAAIGEWSVNGGFPGLRAKVTSGAFARGRYFDPNYAASRITVAYEALHADGPPADLMDYLKAEAFADTIEEVAGKLRQYKVRGIANLIEAGTKEVWFLDYKVAK